MASETADVDVFSMTTCFLNIGSNIDPIINVRNALAWITDQFTLLETSPAYRSPSMGFEGEDFINLAVRIETTLSLKALSIRLKHYEFANGRNPEVAKYSSRSLDIDIVTFGDYVGCFGGILLPRPELFYRPYVLKPVVDIGGDLHLPKSTASYTGLLRDKMRTEPWFLDSLKSISIR